MKHNKLLAAALCAILLINTDAPAAFAQKGPVRHKTVKVVRTKSRVTPGQYPESSERLLTQRDIEHQTPWGMKVMMNEIYARHGYVFKDAVLRKHFRGEKWYRGKERRLSAIKLSDTEVMNVAFIKDHEAQAKR